MTKKISSLLLWLCLAGSALANGQANGFYILRTTDLQLLLPASHNVSDVIQSDLEQKAVAHGYYYGSDCNLYLKAGAFQFRINVREDSFITGGKKIFKHPGEGSYVYDIKIYSDGRPTFRCAGVTDIGKKPSTTRDWLKGDFTAVFMVVMFKK